MPRLALPIPERPQCPRQCPDRYSDRPGLFNALN